MERELRNKFVIVTMSLMCLVFGIFFTVTYFYYHYWFEMDTLQFVQWITNSDVLLDESSESSGMALIELNENHGSYGSVTAVILSAQGEIEDYLYTDHSCKKVISQRIVDKIFPLQEDTWKHGSYIYAWKELPEGKYLLVMTDTRNKDKTPLRYMTTALLVAAGIAALSLLTMYLSRFVTEPARAAMQLEKQFISDASHELKTPLGAISINAQALASTGNDNLHIHNILVESDRMSRLIERLLTLSKLDERAEVPKTAFSLSSCVEEMALTYESVAYEKSISYEYEIAEDISLYGNEDDLRQLMAILIDNAIKHTDPDGGIRISLSERCGSILLCVENTGKGIAPEHLPHIFERFYQADSARKDSSFGLGLAIAKALTERNHGSIAVTSDPGSKTCFTVTFQ